MSLVVLEEINNAMHKVGEKDFQRSYEEGKLEGKKEVTVEFVKRMFDKGFSLDEISDALAYPRVKLWILKVLSNMIHYLSEIFFRDCQQKCWCDSRKIEF